MSAGTIARDLVLAHTRALKLPGVARTFEALARQAREAHWPHEDYAWVTAPENLIFAGPIEPATYCYASLSL